MFLCFSHPSVYPKTKHRLNHPTPENKGLVLSCHDPGIDCDTACYLPELPYTARCGTRPAFYVWRFLFNPVYNGLGFVYHPRRDSTRRHCLVWVPLCICSHLLSTVFYSVLYTGAGFFSFSLYKAILIHYLH